MTDKEFPKDLQEAQAALSNAVYAATSLLEDWENASLLAGNGHHVRQDVCDFAVELLAKRWTGKVTVRPR